jgi:hypothetical protein
MFLQRTTRKYVPKSRTLSIMWVTPLRSRVSSICAAMGCRLDGRSSIPSRGKSLFSVLVFRPALRSTRPSIQPVQCVLYPGVNRPGREADHSPSFSTEFKNGGSIPSFTHMSSQRIAYNYIKTIYYYYIILIYYVIIYYINRLCGIVFRVASYRSRAPGSIPGATRFSEK